MSSRALAPVKTGVLVAEGEAIVARDISPQLRATAQPGGRTLADECVWTLRPASPPR